MAHNEPGHDIHELRPLFLGRYLHFFFIIVLLGRMGSGVSVLLRVLNFYTPTFTIEKLALIKPFMKQLCSLNVYIVCM